MSLQLSMTFKKHIWSTPSEFKDLSDAKEIAIDLETRDDDNKTQYKPWN